MKMNVKLSTILLVLLLVIQNKYCQIFADKKEDKKEDKDDQKINTNLEPSQNWFSETFRNVYQTISGVDLNKKEAGLKHRQDSFNPKSSRYNPNTKSTTCGATCKKSAKIAVKNQAQLEKGAKIQNFVEGSAEFLVTSALLNGYENFDKLSAGNITDFANEVGKSVGMDSGIAATISGISQYVPFVPLGISIANGVSNMSKCHTEDRKCQVVEGGKFAADFAVNAAIEYTGVGFFYRVGASLVKHVAKDYVNDMTQGDDYKTGF